MEVGAAKLSTPVVVTGMHRSGTSAVTQLLGVNGFQFGDNSALLAPSEFNVHGYFERAEIVAFNNKVLTAAASSWRSPPGQGQLQLVSQDWVHAGEQLLERLTSECGADDTPVLKDPRIAVLMPLWRRLAGPNAIFVFCLRNPVSVASSLSRREGIALADGVALWTSYCQSFLSDVGDANHVVVDTDRAYADAPYRELVVATLARECGLPGSSFSDTFDSSVFHERPSRDDFERLVPVEAARTYALLVRASQHLQRNPMAGPLAEAFKDGHHTSYEFFHALDMQVAQERRADAESVARQLSHDLATALAKVEQHEVRAAWQREQFVGQRGWTETPDGLWVQKGEQSEQVIERARNDVERARSEAELLRGDVRALRRELAVTATAHEEAVQALTEALDDAAQIRRATEEHERMLSASQGREYELKEELKSAQETLGLVMSSRSWRITRFLRRGHGDDGIVAGKVVGTPSAAEIANVRAYYPGVSWDWYRERNPDVAQQGCDPAWHYHHFGWLEGRRPVPWFDPAARGADGSEPFRTHLMREE